jgi:hypothetical protein
MRITRRRSCVGALAILGVVAACSSTDDGSPGAPAAPTGEPDGGGGGPDASGADSGGADGGVVETAVLPGASHGAAVSVSADDSTVVMVNRDSASVSVFAIAYPAGQMPVVTKTADVAVGAEPWQVVVHPSGTFALVVLRRDQKVVRIDDLKTAPKRGAEIAVGSEPMSLALTPTGRTAWVASFVDGTLHGIDTASMKIAKTIDLNRTLVDSGILGAGLAARPAMAHPRAVAITNNGDTVEKDEAIYVTDFYAQQKEPIKADGSNADTSRMGILYKIPLDTLAPSIIELPAVADMGFKDVAGNTAGCFPNQLGAINIQGAFGYVASVCASPKGPLGPYPPAPPIVQCGTDADCKAWGVPLACVGATQSKPGACAGCTADAECGYGGKCGLPSAGIPDGVCVPNFQNVKTISTPAVSVIDLGGNKTIATAALNREWVNLYEKLGMADDGNRLLPLGTADFSFIPGTVTAFLAATGSDALFRVDFNATYQVTTIDSVGGPKHPYINLAPSAVDPSRIARAPIGVALTNLPHPLDGDAHYGFVAGDATRTLVVVDLARDEIAGQGLGKPVAAQAAAMPTDPAARDIAEGKRLFMSGLGRWSMNGQGWGACQSCHVDGGSDNVTWFAPRGPAQTSNLDSHFSKKNPSIERIHDWEAGLDEVTDHDLTVRGIFGGIGGIVSDPKLSWSSAIDFLGNGDAQLDGSSEKVVSAVDDWKKIIGYMKQIRSPRRPATLDAQKVEAGRALFAQANCTGCHSGDMWSISQRFYEPDGTNGVNTKLTTTSWSTAAKDSGFPSALYPAASAANQVMRNPGPIPFFFDQITCALRPVGTYNVAEPEVGVAELRSDMATPSQGADANGNGFNPPPLLAVSLGAPYLHSGQVRTLEALFSDRFKSHHQALSSGFLGGADADRAAKLSSLVQFVLSIDDDQQTFSIPALGPTGGSLCAAP